MGETKTKYVCRMLGDGVLPRKHVRLGDVVKVPKRAVRIETPDHEREIPRQDKTQEESALPQGRGESLVAQLDSAVNQAEQLRDNRFSSSTATSWASTSKKRLSKSTGCNPAWRRR